MPRTTKAAGSVALVTGANRGIGLAFVRELAARGAKKIYAGTRHPGDLTDEFAGSAALLQASCASSNRIQILRELSR